MDILERIHGAYYQLPAAERRVADYVLAQYHQVQFMSITQLAEECGSAEATVSRFCRNLGLKGFNAFKIELARHAAAAPRRQEPETQTLAGRCRQAGQLAEEAIHQTVALVDPEQLAQAVSLVEKGEKVLCMGSGGSMLMAQELAHLFSTVTGKFHPVSDSHMQMTAAATMTERDVLVLFSYSGATTGGLQLLELARSRRVPTILVTRFPKSPAASLATVVLRCGSNEGPFQFGSTQAKIAQLMVMEVLFQEYRHRNAEACEAAIESIASALSAMHL